VIYYGILLFFLLEYVRPSSYIPALNALHLNSIVPLSVLAASIASNSGGVTYSEVLRSSNAKWFGFLLFLLCVSILTCDVKQFVLDMATNVVSYTIMYLFLRKEIYNLERLKGIFKVLILAHLVVGALTPEMFSGDGQRHYIASGSFLGDGNDFALSVNIVIPLCIFMMVESQKFRTRALYAGMVLILASAIVATQSRGGILALAAVGLYLWLKSEKKFAGAIGIAVILVGIMVTAPPQFFERMGTMTKTGDEMDGSAQGRIEAWKAGIRMATDHPLTGVGGGHFAVKYGTEYRPEGVGRTGIPWQTAHSTYFVILGELGVPGIIFLLMVIGTNLTANGRMLDAMKGMKGTGTQRRLLVSLNASMIAFAVGGAFLTASQHPHLFLLAALFECGRRICEGHVLSHSTDDKVHALHSLTYQRTPVS